MVKYDDEELTTLTAGAEGELGFWFDRPAVPRMRTSVSLTTATSASVLVVSSSQALVEPGDFGGPLSSIPAPELRASASAGSLSNNTDAYFGYQTAKGPGSTVFDTSNIDLLRPRGGIVGTMFGSPAGTRTLC